MDTIEGIQGGNMEMVETSARDGGAEPMFYDPDLEQFEENEPLKVSPYMLKSCQFLKDKTSGQYSCPFCGYQSMHRSSIKSHLAVHSSARPFACGMCSYEAKRINDLRKHWLIKHGKRLATRSRGYRYRSHAPQNASSAPNSGNSSQHMEFSNTNSQILTNEQTDDHHDAPASISPSSSRSMNRETNQQSKWPSNEQVQSDDMKWMQNIPHHDRVSKWHGSGFSYQDMPVFPLHEATEKDSLRSLSGVSPHAELVDIDFNDADDDDEDDGQTSSENVSVKAEPNDDFILLPANKNTDSSVLENDDICSKDNTKSTENVNNSRNNEPVENDDSDASSEKDQYEELHIHKKSKKENLTSNISSNTTATDTVASHSSPNDISSPLTIVKPTESTQLSVQTSPALKSPCSNKSIGATSCLQIESVTGSIAQSREKTNDIGNVDSKRLSYSMETPVKLKTKQYKVFTNETVLAPVLRNPSRVRNTWSSDSSSSIAAVSSSGSSQRHASVGTGRGWICSFCDIQFFDNAIYFMHMGLHDKAEPWKCTVCGEHLHDVYSFTSHFINGHSSNSNI